MSHFFNHLKKIIPKGIQSRVKHHLRVWLWEGNANNDAPVYRLEDQNIVSLRAIVNRHALLKKLPHSGVVAEIGVADGTFSEEIIKHTCPKKLHLIDVWNSSRYHQGMLEHITQKFMPFLRKGTIEIHQTFSFQAAQNFPDSYFDWIYIDTDHSYITTKKELELFAPKIKEKGIIAGHDFTKGNLDNGLRYGVIEAVYEFCVIHQWELIYITMEMNAFPSFAIRRISK